MRRPLSLLLPLALAACDAGDDFALHLAPIVADAQPWPGGDLTLVVQDADGRRDVPTTGGDDVWTTAPVGAFDGATIGLLWTDPAAAGWDAVRAWGRSAAVSIADGAAELPVLVGAPRRVGTFGRLGEHDAVLAPAAAVLPDGDVVLFGGAALDPSPFADAPEPATGVLRLDLADPDAGFRRVADIPLVDRVLPPRVHATAVPVTVEGAAQVLVVGGRGSWLPAETGLTTTLLFDPVTQALRETGSLHRRRSGHVTLPRPDGRVVVLGGYGGPSTQLLDVEVYEPSQGRWYTGPTVPSVGPIGFAVADLGARGLVVCGGALGGGGLLSAVDGCRLLPDEGEPVALPVLPAGADGIPMRLLAAAVALDDHRVLLAGGVTGAVGVDAAPGTADAWVLDLDDDAGWRPVGPLAVPRALHRLVPLPDGGVLVVGGAEAVAGVPPGPVDASLACAERFDPLTETFTALEPCEPAGAGAYAPLVDVPGVGVWLLAGPGGEDGGRAWGLIPTPPAPTR